VYFNINTIFVKNTLKYHLSFIVSGRLNHIICYPLSIIYGAVTKLRNWMFDGSIILKSRMYDMPIICVGNLSAGGTGKTPHTELILDLLQDKFQVAMLSRGYKRESKGFVLADSTSDSRSLGDEPFQIYCKFPRVRVAVDEKRVNGIDQLLELFPQLDVVVLDDAFQHRYVHPGLSILLTDYNSLYYNDKLLPLGRLREHPKGAIRANIIIVTKCPIDINPMEKRLVVTGIKPDNHQLLLFSYYKYLPIKPLYPSFVSDAWTYERIQQEHASVMIIAGIVSPKPIEEHISKYTKLVFTTFFEDHHDFKNKDFDHFLRRFNSIFSRNKLILVTEKDAARIISNPNYPEALKAHTYMMPIKVEFLNDETDIFNQKILHYVNQNTRNS